MANTPTTNTGLLKPALNDTGWNTTLNGNFDRIDVNATYSGLFVAPHETPSSTLQITVAPGVYLSAARVEATYAGNTFTLAASSTCSVYLTDASVLTSSTTGFPSNTNIVKLATVVTGGSTITSITDLRTCFRSYGNLVAGSAQLALTDSTGGTPSTTLASITAGASYAQADMVALKNAVSSLNVLLEAIRSALVAQGLMKGSS